MRPTLYRRRAPDVRPGRALRDRARPGRGACPPRAGTAHAVQGIMNELDPKTTVEQSLETLAESAAAVKESVASLVDQGGATIGAIKARAADVGKQVVDRGTVALDRTESVVQKNPFASVAIAFGIGYVAMRLRTSPLVKLGLIGGLGYLGIRLARR